MSRHLATRVRIPFLCRLGLHVWVAIVGCPSVSLCRCDAVRFTDA